MEGPGDEMQKRDDLKTRIKVIQSRIMKRKSDLTLQASHWNYVGVIMRQNVFGIPDRK